MKPFKFLLALLTFYFCLLTFSQPVLAHILENVENIGAVMHIQPDDDPVAGSESIVFFEFKDKDNVFEPSNCDCVFSVEQQGKEIYSQPASLSNWDQKLKSLSVVYTFPNKGEYKVRIAGKPSQEETFNEFNLSYDIRVTKEQETAGVSETPVQKEQSINVVPLISIGSLIIIGAVFFMLTRKRKR